MPLFNGKDLNGWKGLVANPRKGAEMSPEELAEAQKKVKSSCRTMATSCGSATSTSASWARTRRDRDEAISPTSGPIELFNGKNLEGLYTWLPDSGYQDSRTCSRSSAFFRIRTSARLSLKAASQRPIQLASELCRELA